MTTRKALFVGGSRDGEIRDVELLPDGTWPATVEPGMRADVYEGRGPYRSRTRFPPERYDWNRDTTDPVYVYRPRPLEQRD